MNDVSAFLGAQKLQLLVGEWSQVGEDYARRHGNVKGTTILLNEFLENEDFKDETAAVSSYGTESAALLALIAKN